MPGSDGTQSAAEIRRLLASRKLEHVVVLGANGTMGYGSGALFTQAVPEVTFLARTKDEGRGGLGGGDPAGALAHRGEPRATSATTTTTSTRAVASADLIFEALTEDFAIKKRDVRPRRRGAARRQRSSPRSPRASRSTSSREGRSESFRQALPRAALLQPAERDRRHRADRRAATPTRRCVDFVEAFSRDAARARDVAHRTTRRRSPATASASRC